MKAFLTIFKTSLNVVAVALLVVPWGKADACSSVMMPNSSAKVMGKNYDWSYSHGKVYINRKNVQKISLIRPNPNNRPALWVSKYASITFNQIAEHFPNGGINSQGLAIEVLLGRAEYPSQSDKPVVSELQWIQFLLDTAATADEAVEQAQRVDIVPVSSYSLHYHACDWTGRCAVFEYIGGKLKTYFEDDAKKAHNPYVLTNSSYTDSPFTPPKNPKFEAPKVGLRDLISGEEDPVSPGYLSRRDEACRLVNEYDAGDETVPMSEVDFMYKILDRIKLFPKWQIAYELENRRVNFRVDTRVHGWTPIRAVRFSDFSKRGDLDCRYAPQDKDSWSESLRYDMETKPTDSKFETLARSDFSTGKPDEKDLIDASSGMLSGLPGSITKALREYSGTMAKCIGKR